VRIGYCQFEPQRLSERREINASVGYIFSTQRSRAREDQRVCAYAYSAKIIFNTETRRLRDSEVKQEYLLFEAKN
jgi:hypothetical protein